MNSDLQALVEKFENGKKYIFRTTINIGVKDESNPDAPVFVREDVEAEFTVSRESPSIYNQFGWFYKGRGAPARVPNFPKVMLFLELYKNGYDIAKIAEVCGETDEGVNEFFAKGIYNKQNRKTALSRLALAVIVKPETEWSREIAG